MTENSVGNIVSDPPYLIFFMSSKWDTAPHAPTPEDEESEEASDHENLEFHKKWLKEAFRVLKPGGVAKIFSATRTYHRLAQAMEQIGFRDLKIEAWCYGSGFPKSLSVEKALDRHLGKSAEREVVGSYSVSRDLTRNGRTGDELISPVPVTGTTLTVTAPVTEAAKRWAGYGSALKPAWEPFLVGRKPL
jgi:site-specific DNA-methyltransferase (adenine-specific)